MADFEKGVEEKVEVSEKFGKEPKRPRTSSGKLNPEHRRPFMVKKRPPPKPQNRPNDVYIGEKTNFQAQLQKCKALLDGEYTEVFLHGLGAAIPRALNVALELKQFYQGTVDYSSTTSTVKLIDDLIPEDEVTPPSYNLRNISSITVHLFRTVRLP